MAESYDKITPIIGLEIHVQLRTRTKMFCGCPVRFEAPPNTCVCPVCLGHPGALPVVNRRAFELGMLGGFALNCEIARFTKWDRKSYFYPDMPKNYQISQYDLPLCGKGYFDITVEAQTRRIIIRRAHLEEDAGKSTHDASGCTLVDLNRAGTPLLEIVTEPDIRSAQEAHVFCTELQRLMTYLDVTEGVMKKGQMRFEPNVNVAIKSGGREIRTPMAEIKNLNSFRSVRRAIDYEIDRQVATWQENPDYVIGKAPNENRGFNDALGITEFQRGKEAAHDYRYFPDPDLVPVLVTDEMLSQQRSKMPELPSARTTRIQQEYGLSESDADTLMGHRPTADLFEDVVRADGPPDVAAKQFVNVWLRLANDRSVPVTELGVDANRMAELARIVSDRTINKTAANQLAEMMLNRPEPPRELASDLGLLQVHDTGATEAWIEQAFAANESAVGDAAGNPKKTKAAAGFLRGQVMKLSGGKAEPKLVAQLIEQRLAKLRVESIDET